MSSTPSLTWPRWDDTTTGGPGGGEQFALVAVSGSSWDSELVLTVASSGAAFSLAGCSAICWLRAKVGGPPRLKLTTAGASPTLRINDAGNLCFDVPAATTATLPAGDYVYDIKVTWPDGVSAALWTSRRFRVTASISGD